MPNLSDPTLGTAQLGAVRAAATAYQAANKSWDAANRAGTAVVTDLDALHAARARYFEALSNPGVVLTLLGDAATLDYADAHMARGDLLNDPPVMHLALPESLVFRSGDSARAILAAARTTIPVALTA
jgi:hypothetical protein